MCQFLHKCLQAGIFEEFYARKEQELERAVDNLFNEYFLEAYSHCEIANSMDRERLTALIHEKFRDDDFFTEELKNELDKHL